jgi:hypothetical protein
MPIGRPKPINLTSEENGKLPIEVRNVKSARRGHQARTEL